MNNDAIGPVRTPYTCKFCSKPINFLKRVALNPDGSKHFCKNAAQDTEEIEYRDDIARLVLQSELAKLSPGDGLAAGVPDYCFEIADAMLAARRRL